LADFEIGEVFEKSASVAGEIGKTVATARR
jgi:hypothetical protein